MDFTKLIAVAEIAVPVFALMGVGAFLARRGLLNQVHCDFLSWFTYRLALPALIFYEIVQHRIAELAEPSLVIAPLLAMAATTLVYMVMARARMITGAARPPFVFGVFWANVAYMGFPLTQNAFAQRGLSLAAIYNAIFMPLTLTMGYGLIAYYLGRTKSTLREHLLILMRNPIIIAVILGLITSLLSEIIRTPAGQLPTDHGLAPLIAIFGSILKLLGSMGLPLALMVVGFNVRFTYLKENLIPLLITTAGRLLIVPLVAYLLHRQFFHTADPQIIGVGVLLAAMPCSVSSSIVATSEGASEKFSSALVAVTTAGSIITIPIWLYVLI